MYHNHYRTLYGTRHYVTRKQRIAQASMHGIAGSNYHASTARLLHPKACRRHYARLVAAGMLTLAQAAQAVRGQ